MTMREHIPFEPGEGEGGWTWFNRNLIESLDTIRGYTMAGWQLVTWDLSDTPDLYTGEPAYKLLLVEKDEYVKEAMSHVR